MTILQQVSAEQLAEARALVIARHQRQAMLGTLKATLAKADARNKADQDFLSQRLDFKRDPNRLAGIAEFLQRNHAAYHQQIRSAYRWFLRDMIEPLPSFYAGMPAPKPRTVDFSALDLYARPYLIGPYLGIAQNNRFAEVDLESSRPSEGRIVLVQSGGPVDGDLWRSHMPAINAWLSIHNFPGTWVLSRVRASRIVLDHKQDLPNVIPFDRRTLVKGSLFVGIDTVTRKPVHIPFSELSAGTYVPGTSGSGKTSALHILLRSIFANLDLFSAVYLIDGKDGVAMSRYARLHPKVRVLYEEPDVWKLAAELTALMRERNAEQRARGIDKATSEFIAVVIDELPTFVAKPPKAQHAEHAAFLDNLQKIAMRGRSAGLRFFFVSQAPVAEQIPVPLRTNCATTIAFRLPENSHATAIFGTLDATNDPRKLKTGQAVVLRSDAGSVTTVQFPFAPLYQPGAVR